MSGRLVGFARRQAVTAYARAYVAAHGRQPSRAKVARELGIPDCGSLSRLLTELKLFGEIPKGRQHFVGDGHGGLLVEVLGTDGTLVIHQNPDGDGNSIVVPPDSYSRLMAELRKLSPHKTQPRSD